MSNYYCNYHSVHKFKILIITKIKGMQLSALPMEDYMVRMSKT